MSWFFRCLKTNRAREPLVFAGRVSEESVKDLIHHIRNRTPRNGTLEVYMTSLGGLNSAATTFFAWFEKFPRRNNVRVVATGDVASAAITLFLAFDRRAAKPGAVFRFHLIAPEKASSDGAVAEYLRVTEKFLVDLLQKRTKMKPRLIRLLMVDRYPLSGEKLLKNGIVNEAP